MTRRRRSDDQFVLLDRSLAAGPAVAAELAREMLASAEYPAGSSRADVSAQLAQFLTATGDLDGAVAALREAVAEGGSQWEDPRIRLAGHLARNGDRHGHDELLATIWRERSDDPWTYHDVGEQLRQLGETAEALKWANTGFFRLLDPDDEPSDDLYVLLALRYQLRVEMGFTEDDFDLLAGSWLDADDD